MKKITLNAFLIRSTLALGGTLMMSVLGSFSVEAAENHVLLSQIDSQAIALGLNDRSELEPGSHLCVNNGDPICGNPALYTSPWTISEEDRHFTPEGFRGDYYESIESGTGPTADQQAILREALSEYYERYD